MTAIRPIPRRRRRHGRRPEPKARYYEQLGPAPKAAHVPGSWEPADPCQDCPRLACQYPPADPVAWRYWRRVWWLLGLDGPYTLTRIERTNLQRLEKRWRRRALGLDPLWAAGETSKGGRLPTAVRAALPPREQEPDPWP